VLDTLTGCGKNTEQTASFAAILGKCGSGRRNTTLHDPDSAYRMMTQINQFESLFKGQFAELSALGDGVRGMEQAGNTLTEVSADMAGEAIVAQVQAFVDQYNTWEDRFDDSVATGGVLDEVQAAEISLYELEQSMQSIFFGASEGFSGLSDLGITIDPVSRQATFDVARFQSALTENFTGVVNTLDEFGSNFSRSAELLNEPDNFIPRQLDNRSRAIDYIASHRTGLEQEFGSGDAAQPAGDVARALTAYNRTYGIG
jgi:hypothetical protein